MAFSKDYYSILNFPSPTSTTPSSTAAAPSPSSSQQFSTADLRRAYKLALLAAHPDKKAFTKGERQNQSVDDVKEAYSVLSDSTQRREYENHVLRNPGILKGRGNGSGQRIGDGTVELTSDFVLGLEVLDLSDFDVLDPEWDVSEEPSESGTPRMNEGYQGANAAAGEKQMEWTRGCRCGAEQGFRILEEELEDAERRGEKEVLVGCEGCSLWVRVGFDVEEA